MTTFTRPIPCTAFVICTLTVVAFAAPGRADTFTRHGRTFQVRPKPNAIVAADLNGDEWPEIVTANTGVKSSVGTPSARYTRPE